MAYCLQWTEWVEADPNGSDEVEHRYRFFASKAAASAFARDKLFVDGDDVRLERVRLPTTKEARLDFLNHLVITEEGIFEGLFFSNNGVL